MQNDAHAQFALLGAGDEEYKKQLALLLEKRRHFRQFSPVHPADEPAISSEKGPSPSKPEKRKEIVDRDERKDGDREAPRDPLIVEPHAERGLSAHVQPKRMPENSYGLVVVSCSFRHLPSLAEKTKEIATMLFNALVGARFSRFSRRGSRLLLNPSVIEFQDTMRELQGICEKDSSFFMCLSSHGARVVKGANEGSYVLFSETRLSSEDELLLTAIHESELARLIQGIPSTSKLVAVELCHAHESNEAPSNVANAIRNRIHGDFSPRLYKNLAKLHLESSESTSCPSSAEEGGQNVSAFMNTVLLEACDPTSEVSLGCAEDGVSNFLHRLNDAFRGGAVAGSLEADGEDRRPLYASEVVEYVREMVRSDAEKHDATVKDEYKKQVRTKYELVAEFREITQTAQLVGAGNAAGWGLGSIPAPPNLAPTIPKLVSATLNSIDLSWEYATAAHGADAPTILGYHIQYRGDGRASVAADSWKRASSFQVLAFEQVVREKEKPPMSVSVFGLSSDTAYCFRVRARGAGGWGPFSIVSSGYRTLSFSSTLDQFSTVQRAISTGGVQGVMVLMKKHSEIRAVQLHCVRELARMAIRRELLRQEKAQFLPSLDMPIVNQVCVAMQKFKHDFTLQRHASLFIGRLGASDAIWRKKLVACKEPDILAALQDVANRFEGIDYETHSSARWACMRLRGEPTLIRRKPSATEAAKCIQGMYRSRKARQHVRTLAQAIYRQAVDPATGMPYFYNTRTGETSWSMPAFLS